MKPIEFKEYNKVYAKDQSDYLPIPVFESSEPSGEIISCWKLSFVERLRLLFTGKIWVCLLMFHKPLTPSFLTTKKSDVLITK